MRIENLSKEVAMTEVRGGSMTFFTHPQQGLDQQNNQQEIIKVLGGNGDTVVTGGDITGKNDGSLSSDVSQYPEWYF